jgi:thioredoxin reductase (NADPH)
VIDQTTGRTTGRTTTITATALFVLIGAQPHTSWLAGTAARDPQGYLLTGRSVNRVAAAVGEGATAVRLIHTYLAGEYA